MNSHDSSFILLRKPCKAAMTTWSEHTSARINWLLWVRSSQIIWIGFHLVALWSLRINPLSEVIKKSGDYSIFIHGFQGIRYKSFASNAHPVVSITCLSNHCGCSNFLCHLCYELVKAAEICLRVVSVFPETSCASSSQSHNSLDTSQMYEYETKQH